LGVSTTINSNWLQLLALALLFLSVSLLIMRARRRRSYGPFCLGLVAAVAIYLSKFRLNYDLGVYLSCVALVGASIWNALPQREARDNTQCQC
jgi:low temperature requirement protein LtrA